MRESRSRTIGGARRSLGSDLSIKLADPEVVEEVKWRKPSNPAGVPVWSHAGIICTGDTYKSTTLRNKNG